MTPLIPLLLNSFPAHANILILNVIFVHQGAAINMRSISIALDAARVGCRVAKSAFFAQHWADFKLLSPLG